MWRNIFNLNFGLFLGLCVLCASLSAVFLMRREGSSYFEHHSAGSFGSNAVSTFTYYFVWPESQRETVAQDEEFVAVGNAMAGGTPSSALADRMQRNIVLAILFGILSAGIAFALWVAKSSPENRRLTNRMPDR